MRTHFNTAAGIGRKAWKYTKRAVIGGVLATYGLSALSGAALLGVYHFGKPFVGETFNDYAARKNLDPHLFNEFKNKNILVTNADVLNTRPGKILQSIYTAGHEFNDALSGNAASTWIWLEKIYHDLPETPSGYWKAAAIYYAKIAWQAPNTIWKSFEQQPQIWNGPGTFTMRRQTKDDECHIIIDDEGIPAKKLGPFYQQMDKSGLAPGDIYTFALLHEIGHCDNNIEMKNENLIQKYFNHLNALFLAQEINSDRFALSRMTAIPNWPRFYEFVKDLRVVMAVDSLDYKHNTALFLQDPGSLESITGKDSSRVAAIYESGKKATELAFMAGEIAFQPTLKQLEQLKRPGDITPEIREKFIQAVGVKNYVGASSVLVNGGPYGNKLDQDGVKMLELYVAGFQRLFPYAVANTPQP